MALFTKRVSIGEETSFEPLTSTGISFDGLFQWINSFTQLKPIAAALIAILLFIPYYSWLGEDDVHAYVNIDINPSVELSVNDEYEVIGVEGLNEDGRSLVQQLSNWEHQSIQKVSAKILNLSDQLGYLNENHQILLGISFVDQLSHGDDNLVLQEVSKQMETNFKSVSVASFEVPKDVREKAKKEKASMNLMYASEILEKREAQQDNVESQSNEEQTDDEQQVEKHENSKDSSQPSTNKTEHQSVSKEEDKNIEVIERFLQNTNKEQLPPGLKKKLEKFQEKQDWKDFDKKEFRKNKDSDDEEDNRSHNEKGEKDEDDHRSNKGKSKDEDHPSHKGEDHPSNKEKSDKKKEQQKDNDNNDDEGWTPPGLKDKEKHNDRDDDNRDQNGVWDFFDQDDRDDEKEERGKGHKKDRDDEGWTPPGLDKKDKRDDRKNDQDDDRDDRDWDDDRDDDRHDNDRDDEDDDDRDDD
ncbi:hypothetical protein E3U55_07525 [Filobacillus milosensis]|uniref:Anti-sigma factor RsgI-like middle domain-containing protein n=1 Tax=Filobacillus milosensis TaxID=94137 RepID=A0A4Y8IP32_9BACI|nr:hypothetical protein [Filobacillus milosensis]TFB22144.1 hypothetical protein E3U55_07525 [Filobacillus milosensis]